MEKKQTDGSEINKDCLIKSKTVKCNCGKDRHRENAIYCANCGKKIRTVSIS